jgi:ATP-binding cassette subfamily B protein
LLYYFAMAAPELAREETSLWAGLKEVYRQMSRRRRRQLFAVLALMLAGAAAEFATIGAVIPFLALLANPGGAVHHSRQFFLTIPGPGSGALIAATAAFMFLVTLGGLVRLQLAWSSRSFVFGLGHDLALEIQRRVLLQPFSFHINRNTSSLLGALNKTEVLIFDVLLPLMHAATSAVIAVFIVAILLFIDPITTLSAAFAFALIYGLTVIVIRKRLAANSRALGAAYDERLQTVQESLGGIRDVIIDRSQSMYLRAFAAVDSRLSDTRVANQFISAAPRYFIETIGILAIAIIAVLAAERQGGIMAAVPTLGAIALGAQRLLPLVQQIYSSWSTAAGEQVIFNQVVELLQLPVEQIAAAAAEPLKVRREIRLENVSFAYPTRNKATLEGVTLSIPIGSMIGLIGATGSGKSTLLDLLMGLLEPDGGKILIDGVPLTAGRRPKWFRTIAHVPQSIFLSDSTIARNIALSLPDMAPDFDRIVESAKMAQLHDFIASLPAGYETFIGERGIRISGGQRQRLGIARAIYKNAPVLIFDEATSALDEATEAAVIATFEQLRRRGRTIVIVAHRASTIRHCDFVARLDHGRLVDFGPFGEVLGAQAKLS